MDKPSKLKKQEVIEWFGTPEIYKRFHSENIKLTGNEKYIIEDE